MSDEPHITERQLKVLVADDHNLVREMIADVLGREAGAQVSQASSVSEVLSSLAEGYTPDLVLLDYNMPGMDDLNGLAQVLVACGKIPVAIISGVANRIIAERALVAGAAGFLPKTIKARSLVNAVRFMVAGEIFVPVSFMTTEEEIPAAAQALQMTSRELEVLQGLCEALSNKEIARRLDLQEVTVKLHVKTLSRKLGARNRTHAAMIAREMSLVL
ncbi:hypothetical protein Q669_32010 [Labrenzia sp. C1B10]|uniref:response regulator n=1 Tax=unclassified Labrenzia TaxID=2648686 RepID=UPI0003B86DD2|nr:MULTISPECIES: response regulator transcription factor [unclassified Labrenzia]ERP91226.1 hypothetical protein Q669_32010 [Labrenzia sp. C1B10]ERS04177.1 hypothetical protein Q675_30780 [Labrenzia sp. C1B70]